MIRWSFIICSFSLTVCLIFADLPERIGVDNRYEDLLTCVCFMVAVFLLIYASPVKDEECVCKIKNFTWNMNDFCRGWLVTGKTGSGKTASAIAHILHQLFQRVAPENKFSYWGGVAVDQKGNFFKIIEDIAAHYKQSDRLVTLQVCPEGAQDWTPKYCYNLLSYPGIPASTYAKIIIDTAASLGQDSGGGSGNFFKTQAQLHIEKAIGLLTLIHDLKESPELISFAYKLNDEIKESQRVSDLEFYHSILPSYVSLKNIFTLLTDKVLLKTALCLLNNILDGQYLDSLPAHKSRAQMFIDHFEYKFLQQPPDQLGGVTATIYNYLGFFTSDDICQVFCAEHNTVEFEQVDQGYIFSVAMPQRYQSERVYVNTLMKLIYYTHALRRFDDPDKLPDKNLLLFIADEAQGVITASKNGMTDYSVLDKIREAKATALFAAQSTTSFLPVMKKEQVDTLILNLANQVHYTVADENNAKLVADIIGRKEILKKSRGFSGGKASYNYQPTDEHIIKPYALRAMKKFECVLIHCESGHKKFTLPPISPDGKVPDYFKKIKHKKRAS